MSKDFFAVSRESLLRVKGVYHKAAATEGTLNGYDWMAYDEIAAVLLGYSKPAPPNNASEESEAE